MVILFICLIKIFPGEGEINVGFNETVNKNVFSKSNPTELNLLDKNFSAHEAENFWKQVWGKYLSQLFIIKNFFIFSKSRNLSAFIPVPCVFNNFTF